MDATPRRTGPGLACHLLGIETERALASSPFLGPLFEGFVASEVGRLVVHRPGPGSGAGEALAPGVHALGVPELFSRL